MDNSINLMKNTTLKIVPILKNMVLFGLCFINPNLTVLVFLLLLFCSLRNVISATKAVILGTTIAFLNPGLLKFSGVSEAIRWLLLIALVIQLVRESKIIDMRSSWAIPLLIWIFYSLVASLLFSQLPVISIFKLLSFLLGFISINFAVSTLTKSNYQNLLNWAINLVAAIFLLSIPLYFNFIGYLRNGSGFQGIFNHPNSFAIFMAIGFCVYLFIFLSEEISRHTKYIFVLILATMMFFLIETEARTSIVATLLVTIYLLLCNFISNFKIKKVPIVFFAILAVFIAIILLLLAINWTLVIDNLENIVFKGGNEDILYSSRNILNNSLSAFWDNPWFGNGFGVDYIPSRAKSFVLTTSYPVEKRNIILALLSDTGIIGLGLFSLFLLCFMNYKSKKIFDKNNSVFFLGVLINLGELVFFSTNGLGMLVWFFSILIKMNERQLTKGRKV